MESLVMIGIIFLLGAVGLSMIAQRQGPPPAPVFIVRAEPIERLPASDAGPSLVLLILVIGAAIWLL